MNLMRSNTAPLYLVLAAFVAVGCANQVDDLGSSSSAVTLGEIDNLWFGHVNYSARWAHRQLGDTAELYLLTEADESVSGVYLPESGDPLVVTSITFNPTGSRFRFRATSATHRIRADCRDDETLSCRGTVTDGSQRTTFTAELSTWFPTPHPPDPAGGMCMAPKTVCAGGCCEALERCVVSLCWPPGPFVP